MPTALLGKKIGMTRVFDESGEMIPVTVIEAGPCSVLQVKTNEKEGYRALQLGFDDRTTGEQWDRIKKEFGNKKLQGNLKGLRRPMIGHLTKTAGGATPKRFIKEVPLGDDENFKAGDLITIEIAAAWKKVDIIGKSKGRGMAGTIRAWNFSSGPRAHGSKNRRNPGSSGMGTTPGRVIKGKKMFTRWGNERATIRNLDVVSVDTERNLVLVRGGVPGPTGGYVVIRKAVATRVKQ